MQEKSANDALKPNIHLLGFKGSFLLNAEYILN